MSSGCDPLEVRRRNYYAQAPGGCPQPGTHLRQQTDALRHGGRGFHSARHGRSALAISADYDAPARGRGGVECANNPVLETRHRADAGEVRDLLHADPSQPGRRAGACLPGRLGPSEPWRHRDGPGPVPEGGAGGGRRGSAWHWTRVKITATDTGKVPNTSATAASSGSRSERHGGARPPATRSATGWPRFWPRRIRRQPRADRVSRAGRVSAGEQLTLRRGRAGLPMMARVSLSATGFYKTPKVDWDRDQRAGPSVLLFRLWRGGDRGGDRHADRRKPHPARRHPARRRRRR